RYRPAQPRTTQPQDPARDETVINRRIDAIVIIRVEEMPRITVGNRARMFALRAQRHQCFMCPAHEVTTEHGVVAARLVVVAVVLAVVQRAERVLEVGTNPDIIARGRFLKADTKKRETTPPAQDSPALYLVLDIAGLQRVRTPAIQLDR